MRARTYDKACAMIRKQLRRNSQEPASNHRPSYAGIVYSQHEKELHLDASMTTRQPAIGFEMGRFAPIARESRANMVSTLEHKPGEKLRIFHIPVHHWDGPGHFDSGLVRLTTQGQRIKRPLVPGQAEPALLFG